VYGLIIRRTAASVAKLKPSSTVAASSSRESFGNLPRLNVSADVDAAVSGKEAAQDTVVAAMDAATGINSASDLCNLDRRAWLRRRFAGGGIKVPDVSNGTGH
jgi:hypothetical protein